MAKRAEYGKGHDAFLEYVKFIVNHPTYAGMPDLNGDKGVQWVASPNRKGGKFQHSHLKRMEWWRKKAAELGIEQTGEWPSEVAKRIHPTKQKPCIKCGKVMDIRYAYPASNLRRRIQKLAYIGEEFPVDECEHIRDLLTRMVEQFGNRVFADLPAILKADGIDIPALEPTLDAWLKWVEEVYIPNEPRGVLSPGVMSNCPDRLDGFHSFNRCCRAGADPGRSKENLKSYSTDRRVFEYWVDGNWIAADHMMAAVRSDEKLKGVTCKGGHTGPCSADHIGPISLGFAHRPAFQFLCKACNSGKNNRMWPSDVSHLLAAEARGEEVTSWYCKRVWDLCKALVTTPETAKRLSKMLRDNRHTMMLLLGRVAAAGHYTFLCTFLGLDYADLEPTFVGLRAVDHITAFDELKTAPRENKYAAEQKARRLRVAFSALADYIDKDNRNAFDFGQGDDVKPHIEKALTALAASPESIKQLDNEIREAVTAKTPAEEILRGLVAKLPGSTAEPENFKTARTELSAAMEVVADRLRAMWTDDRFVRELDEEDEVEEPTDRELEENLEPK